MRVPPQGAMYAAGPMSPDMRNLHHKRKTKMEGGYRRDEGRAVSAARGQGERRSGRAEEQRGGVSRAPVFVD